MLGAYRRRRREELLALGTAINYAVGDPKKLQALDKLIPDLERSERPVSMTGPNAAAWEAWARQEPEQVH